MKKEWTSGKILAVVFGGIGASVILIVSLYASLRQLSASIRFLDRLFFDSDEAYYEEADSRTELLEEPDKEEWEDTEPEDEIEDDDWQDDDEEEKASKDKHIGKNQYYEFHNEISKGLSYQIKIDEFAEFAGNKSNVFAGGDYPKVTCEDKDKEHRINKIIYREIESILEHLEYIGGELDDEEIFIYEVESYVTYMDEDVLSVAYLEYGYLDDEMFETYVISVNVDMESGLAMTNSQILNINDDFSIDFRERTERQNGSNDILDYYSDQEITQMLNDEDSLIIFYTPLGMEVGFNYYYGWVTVTYPDYTKFVNPL